MTAASVSEFQRRIALEELDSGEVRRTIEADPKERQALARRFDVVAVEALHANVRMYRVSGGPLVGVEGRLTADVVQQCVVTLAALPVHVEMDFVETFGPAGYSVPADATVSDVPETFDDDSIDLGELVAQILLLSLDPYPRAPGIDGAPLPGSEESAGDRVRPFAGLGEMLAKCRK